MGKVQFMDDETVKVINAGAIGTVITTLSRYCELLNPILTVLIGIASLLYICFKIYWLNKNKGKEE